MWQFNAMQTILKQILRYNSVKMNSKIRAKKVNRMHVQDTEE